MGSAAGRNPSPGALAVVVSLGTDHHPFDRLVQWADDWVRTARESGRSVRYTVQHGASRPSDLAENVAILPRDALLALLASCDLAVVQAGPGSIRDARSLGLVPLVVPRRAALGEVVDDHQVDFAQFMAQRGECRVATDQPALVELLDRYADSPQALRRPWVEAQTEATAEAVRRALVLASRSSAGGIDRRRAWHTLSRLTRAQQLFPRP